MAIDYTEWADGYSFAEAGKIARGCYCADCWGPLKKDFHDNPPDRLHDWIVKCRKADCPSVGYVPMSVVDNIKAKQAEDADKIKHLHKERLENMPIPVTQNAKPSFRRLGRIKKGIQITEEREKLQGKKKVKYEVTYPKELPHFVMDFDPEEAEAAAVFFGEYGQAPNMIRIVPPFDEIEDFWDGWFKTYKGTRLIARAGLNPALAVADGLDPNQTVYFERLFDVALNKWTVKHWRGPGDKPMLVDWSVNVDERNGEYLGPIIYSTSKKDYYLVAVGTLKVMVKELVPFVGYMVLNTRGKVDVNNISSELAGIQLMAKQADIPLHQFPLMLTRREEMGRDPDGNATKHWNVHIGVDPDFSKKLYLLTQAKAERQFLNVLEADYTEVAQLPAGDPDPEDEDYFDELPEDDTPAEWSNPGLVRSRDDYHWLFQQAGIDYDQAEGIWSEHKKDYTGAYNYVLKAFAVPLGISNDNGRNQEL